MPLRVGQREDAEQPNARFLANDTTLVIRRVPEYRRCPFFWCICTMVLPFFLKSSWITSGRRPFLYWLLMLLLPVLCLSIRF
jgi:hypothetical protein